MSRSAQRRQGLSVTIWPTLTTTDGRGNLVVAVDWARSFTVRAAVVRSRSKDGARLLTLHASEPLDEVTAWSVAEVQGIRYDLLGSPMEYGKGALRHVELDLVERVHVGEREASG